MATLKTWVCSNSNITSHRRRTGKLTRSFEYYGHFGWFQQYFENVNTMSTLCNKERCAVEVIKAIKLDQ